SSTVSIVVRRQGSSVAASGMTGLKAERGMPNARLHHASHGRSNLVPRGMSLAPIVCQAVVEADHSWHVMTGPSSHGDRRYFALAGLFNKAHTGFEPVPPP